MRAHIAKTRRLALVVILMLWGAIHGTQAAEGKLHWDALEVDARLDSDGVLDVFERHTMVFTGDWNGGERVFNLRPRQKLEFISLERVDSSTGAQQQLREARRPLNIDEFSWPNTRTLRWRSRLSSDPPFAGTSLTYVLHYKLSGILLKDEAQYRLDHDFAFPNRAGSIARFSLSLVLDPVWRPLNEIRDRYTAGPLVPGQSFVLTIPLDYSGTDVPIANDGRRPKEIVGAVVVLFGMFALVVLGFFAHERSLGRFARIDLTSIDGAWIEKHILAHPAEVVGAVWDGRIGTPEVVALIARMVGEGKLESEVGDAGSMKLRLKVDRSTLDGHERVLVDGLFFDNRTETSTKAVQEHYRSTGFDPSAAIKPHLKVQVESVMPPGKIHVGRLADLALFLLGVALLAWTVYRNLDPALLGAAVAVAAASLVLGALLQIPGWLFRSRIDWGMKASGLCMIPAFLVCLGTAAILWLVAGAGLIELPLTMIGAITIWAIFVSNASLNSMKSRQSRAAIAFRKRLAVGRTYFQKELEKPRPDLRDNWYPWLLSFGLGRQVDVWSAQHAATSTESSTWHSSRSSSSNTSTTTGTGWTGGGGLSGGAGASGTWAAAAAGMAAGIASPSSSSSSGGGGSSSGGSSGGGGGGGW